VLTNGERELDDVSDCKDKNTMHIPWEAKWG